MADLSRFPITGRWPPRDPSVIQLYSLATPNGVKASIMLEECGLPYEVHKIDIGAGDQMTPEFLSLAPNNKIPAMLDPAGPDGTPMGLWESGAILIYLAEKTGKLLPADGPVRHEVLQWLMWQMGGIGPMFGQYGYFNVFAGKEIEDERPRRRYADEARRLLAVLERALAGRDWVAGAYSIADIAIASWLWGAATYYRMPETLGWSEYPRVQDYLARFTARPAVQRGLAVPPRG